MLPILKKGFGIVGGNPDHTDSNRSTSIDMCTCTICGGSGIQRISSQRFRTCFTCLGQGQISAAIHAAGVPNIAPAAGSAAIACLSANLDVWRLLMGANDGRINL